ncbi:MAG: helix-turn-helix transcriptional regulator [Geminicoccaceae bacterium]|nr:helix-turn-helix transcriptional regulator [Geminicoccaceae bacterium]
MSERARGTSAGARVRSSSDPAGPPLASFLIEGRLCHVVAAAKGALGDGAIGRLRLDGRPYLVILGRTEETRVQRLTRREREIAWLVAEGLLTKQIAHRLGLSPHTVTAYVNRIYARLGCRNRAEMVAALAGLLRRCG